MMLRVDRETCMHYYLALRASLNAVRLCLKCSSCDLFAVTYSIVFLGALCCLARSVPFHHGVLLRHNLLILSLETTSYMQQFFLSAQEEWNPRGPPYHKLRTLVPDLALRTLLDMTSSSVANAPPLLAAAFPLVGIYLQFRLLFSFQPPTYYTTQSHTNTMDAIKNIGEWLSRLGCRWRTLPRRLRPATST